MVNDLELCYEIRLSQGRGILTERGKKMLLELCQIQKDYKWKSYNNDEDREDSNATASYYVFKAWDIIDLKYTRKSVPYFVECYARGVYHYMTNEMKFKDRKNELSLSKIFENYEE